MRRNGSLTIYEATDMRRLSSAAVSGTPFSEGSGGLGYHNLCKAGAGEGDLRKDGRYGLKHGTVTIIKHGKGYEVTTYRIDGEYLDGRHPETVEFTPDLREDLKRRDFTINAMAYSHETGIVDEFEGMEDLKRRVIRCVGCARDRFTEDALRILRAVRFAAQLDFVIEDETYRRSPRSRRTWSMSARRGSRWSSRNSALGSS